MPSADDSPPPGEGLPVSFSVRTSVVMELLWVAMLHAGEPSSEYPIRAGRFDTAPDLPERIAAFWGDGEVCFTELFVIADRGGVLFESDPDAVWAGLMAGTTAPARFEELASETPEDQIRFRTRVVRLHDDDDLRRRWIDLQRDIWAAVAPQLDAEGRRAVAALAGELEGKLLPGGHYADLDAVVHHDFKGLLPRLVASYAASGREVTVVPAWYARKCFVVSLPDRLVVSTGAPPRPAGPSEVTRNRARRLKALGDPTRLAILEASRQPRTVGELAVLMGVAQPTVSNHVRILRDAGLLNQVKDGSRRLQADSASLAQLAEELLHAVGPRS